MEFKQILFFCCCVAAQLLADTLAERKPINDFIVNKLIKSQETSLTERDLAEFKRKIVRYYETAQPTQEHKDAYEGWLTYATQLATQESNVSEVSVPPVPPRGPGILPVVPPPPPPPAQLPVTRTKEPIKKLPEEQKKPVAKVGPSAIRYLPEKDLDQP